MKKQIAALAILIALCFMGMPPVQAQVSELTIGGTSASSTYVPVYGAKAADASYHSQCVYPEDSIPEMLDKMLVGMVFYTKNAAASAFDSHFEVRIGTTETGAFVSSALLDNMNFTKVYSGMLDATGETMAIVFDTPYDYRGGNLVVDIHVKEAGEAAEGCSFKGSTGTYSSIMRCTGIAGRYNFMPRVTMRYEELPATAREATHTTTVQICKGSTGDYYDWNLQLERQGGATYDTTIYHLAMGNINFSGSDTTIAVSHAMPRYLLGCADTERLEMTLYNAVRHYVYDTVCQNTGFYTDYGLNIDLNTNQTGTKTYLTAESEWGSVYDVHCDDTTYLQLTINRTYSLSRNLNICTSRISEDEEGFYYMYGSHRIDIAEVPTESSIPMTATLYGTTSKGCDSTLVLNITVSPSDRSDTTIYVRESELPYTTMGMTFAYASTRSKMYYNQYNCDSIVRITLSLKHTYRDTTYVTGCGDYDWTVLGEHLATIGHDTLASHLLTSADGLDSVVYLRYTRGSINRADTTVTACESYTFKDVEYTASNNVYDTVAGIGMECDTQYTWHIRINHPIYREETQDVCDSLMWNGTLYRESTTDVYYYTANACENADTLHLTVRYSSIGDTTVYAAQSFIYLDSTFNESGNYRYVIENGIGCDSLVSIHLYVTPHGTPMPQLYAYEKNVLILNHYPYGDNTRVDYDSIFWERDGALIDGFHGDTYHNASYGQLSGCYKVWVLIDGEWFPTNELCMSNGIGNIDDETAFRIWPNPVHRGEMLNCELNFQVRELPASERVMAIYDLSGRKLVELPLNETTTRVRCDMENGSYMVKIGNAARRIVVF